MPEAVPDSRSSSTGRRPVVTGTHNQQHNLTGKNWIVEFGTKSWTSPFVTETHNQQHIQSWCQVFGFILIRMDFLYRAKKAGPNRV